MCRGKKISLLRDQITVREPAVVSAHSQPYAINQVASLLIFAVFLTSWCEVCVLTLRGPSR